MIEKYLLPSGMSIFISAIMGKIVASTITYPHVVIRTKLHDNRNDYRF